MHKITPRSAPIRPELLLRAGRNRGDMVFTLEAVISAA